ncbi:MAG: T9SS type A sorting domain-containing protein [Flavobacteriia bacterium]|nr:T9SS type A sorting domain-containing protein [Flavobacteriia bacterium]
MKKLIFSLIWSASFYSNAQNITIIVGSNNATNMSGQTYITNVNNVDQVNTYITINNNTGATQSWYMTVKNLTNTFGWEDAFTWGSTSNPLLGGCYSPIIMNTTLWTTPNNSSGHPAIENGNSGTLVSEITPNGTGQGRYRYLISLDGATFIDSIDVLVNYSAGLNDFINNPSFSMSPNPANDIVSLDANDLNVTGIKMLDLLGNIVYTENNVSDNKKIDVSNFKNGVYFVIIEINGKASLNRKLVIKH